MFHNFKALRAAGIGLIALMAAGAASADTISPDSYSADLDVGESVTIRKTVVVQAAGTTSALIDAMFLIDTSGSMGAEIANAKAAAGSLFSGLSGFGNIAAGVGVFSERALLGDAIRSDLSTNTATTIDALNAVTLGDPDFGGDFPESSNTAIDLAASNLSWRPGSNRFMFVLGDASAKGTPDAEVIASLAAERVTLVGLNFGGAPFGDDITDLGGTVFDGGTSPEDIIAAVTAGITTEFSTYSTVGVSDLGAGSPEIGFDAVCVGADSGACNGALAEGTFDRSVDRSFDFDVTFTRTAAGDKTFSTLALVDGGATATETDSFSAGGEPPMPAVPLPAAGWLLVGALGGLGALRRRKAA